MALLSTIKSIFSVSQPRAGHHAVEMMMRAALGDTFRYCEFYTEPNCCQKIPCARIAHFEQVGYQVFLQKSHDHQLADPIPRADLILVQTREPILRALSNYELDLESHERQHSPEYLNFWLAQEAHYVIGFCSKWVTADIEARLILAYEKLVNEPLQSLHAILEAAGVVVADEAIVRGTEQLRFSARDHAAPFKRRTLADSRYFDPNSFGEFAALLLSEGGAMGYDLDNIPLQMNGSVTAIFMGISRINGGHYREAIAELQPIVATGRASREVMNILARAMSQVGRSGEARAIAERLVEQEAQYFGGYALCADEAYRTGAIEDARQYLRLWIERSKNLMPIRAFLNKTGYDSTFLNNLPSELRPSVSRAAVTAGFRWILGRNPESEATVENHMRCSSEEELRQTLFRSQEFATVLERVQHTDEKSWSDDLDGPLKSGDLAAALRWILGRAPSSQEVETLGACSSAGELRARLMGTDEFLQSHSGAR